MDGYYTATTIIAADPSRAMVSAAHRHHYLRRSLAFLKECQFPTRDVSHPRSEFMTLTFFCDTWTVCINTPPLHDHRIIFLSESVNGGLLFMLERASYFPCDLDGRLEKVVGAALASLVTIPVYLFTEVRPIREKVFSQSEVIARRMEQNPNIQPSIRKIWSNFLHSEARVLRRNSLEGPFCSNYGCETLEVAGQQCPGCKTRFYCSKECQTSDWRRFHKLQCTRPARTNAGLAGTS
ncbi:hypothetical protein DL93DRAFT_2088048 [Clavulina sp. PMI_390]|nr:hypothetical protein DL93DRAFT_2088048 [Clavulina sp. PMI_390]